MQAQEEGSVTRTRTERRRSARNLGRRFHAYRSSSWRSGFSDRNT